MSSPAGDALSRLAALVSAGLASSAPDDPSGVGPLVDEMAAAWTRGERPPAEDFLDRRPELWNRPDEAMRLVYEEICLRQERGEPEAAAAVIARFPRWRARLERLLDCHRLLNSGPRPSDVAVGDHVGEFRLLAELGRGAAGGVFLASQPALSDRPVVLKITPLAGSEHLSLARLQHTHIVPLYTAFDDPPRGLRVLCMPYFGGASLARLAELLADIPPARRTGRDLLAALDHVQANASVQLPAGGPARQFVERASFARAVCWFGVCLADALQYAHDRGLVHFDLKPANVLVAADGTPMLLDFHLARPALPAGAPPHERLGGTPLFMAPEQARAVAAFHRNEPAPDPVDGRADVYALGLTLYQLLGGPFPPDPGRRSPLPRANPQVSVGLADIVSKCLAPNPAGRYRTAAAVADDLRRHLNDLSLRGVRNRSPSEWWGKWRRRRPHAALAAAGVIAFAAAGVAAGGQVRHRYLDADAALKEARRLHDAGDFSRAAEVVERGLRGVDGYPFASRTRDDLRRELGWVRSAEQARKLAEAGRNLRTVADRIRFAAIADPLPPAHARELEATCRELWAARDRFDLTDEPARNDLLDIAVVGAGLRVRLAPAGQEAAAHRDALRVLDEAEATLGANAALELERAEHGRALNLPGPGRPGVEPARTVWDHVRVGRADLRAGRTEDADRHFAAALARDPGNFWATFYRGHCAHRLGRHDDALTAFTVCVALSPDSAECHVNRGLINLVLKRYEAARRDFEAALARGGDATLIRGHLATLPWSGSAVDP